MIEMPEAATIARQMKDTLVGKTIYKFARGNLTHKFLWLNRSDEEYQRILSKSVVTNASSFGRSIYLHLGDHMLWWGDTGGKLLYNPPNSSLPPKYHLIWYFEDGSALTFAMQMWGWVKLLDKREFRDIPVDESGLPPLHPDFTFQRFTQMLEAYPQKTKTGIKGFLVATGYVVPDHINGLGNAIIQDILFKARISPKRIIPLISLDERHLLFDAILETLSEAIRLGGRYDEVDLFGQKGRYLRIMDNNSVGTPCIQCGKVIQKISYLGGACFICPNCQT